jgi:hypothetical protein
MVWITNKQPFGQNHAPLLTGVSSADETTTVPVAVDPTTGALLTYGAGGSSTTVVGIGPVGQYQVNYDSIVYTATSAAVDTYTYHTGGVAGAVTATVTVTYTDGTHATLVSVVRT